MSVSSRSNLKLNLQPCQDHAKWIPVATVSFQYMPEITINRALMDTLTEEQKEDWVKATPNPVFRYNNITKQVLLCPYQNLLGKLKLAEADFGFQDSVQSSGQNTFQRMYLQQHPPSRCCSCLHQGSLCEASKHMKLVNGKRRCALTG